MTAKAVAAALRQYLDELRAEYRTLIRQTPEDHSLFRGRVGYDDPVDVDLHEIAEMLADFREALGRRRWSRAYAEADELADRHRLGAEHRIELAEGVLGANITALEELKERLLGRPVPHLGSHDPQQATKPGTRGPRLTEAAGIFLREMQERERKPWAKDKAERAAGIYRLLKDWSGDLLVSDFKRSDVHGFYRAAARLPKTHGKSPKDAGRTLQERIQAAEGRDVERLSSKTLETYGTLLIALFEHFKDVDDPTWMNPAGGFDFRTVGGESTSRDMWEGEALRKLFGMPVWAGASSQARLNEPGSHVFADERYWMPLLALYTGARREELARLVRDEVKTEDGIAYLLVTDEEPPVLETGEKVQRKRRVKSEAARRRIPLHRALLDLGFMEYVRHVAPRPSDVIFPRLRPNLARQSQRGDLFGKWFTRYKERAGYKGPKLVFHSFRAGAATKLFNAPGVPAGHVVAIIGHEAKIASMLGVETLVRHYNKAWQVPLRDLHESINRIEFPEVGPRQPTEFSDGAPFPRRNSSDV